MNGVFGTGKCVKGDSFGAEIASALTVGTLVKGENWVGQVGKNGLQVVTAKPSGGLPNIHAAVRGRRLFQAIGEKCGGFAWYNGVYEAGASCLTTNYVCVTNAALHESCADGVACAHGLNCDYKYADHLCKKKGEPA